MSEDRNVSVAKIVATPSESSWAQAYSAGKLFAVLSLESKEELKEKDYLNLLGKGVLETLEQEFFTLELKDLASIKNAVQITAGRIPHDISCSFVVASIVNDVLYVFTIGAGRIDIKRGDKIGNILESQESRSSSIVSASGVLLDSDLIIIQTKQFTEIITPNILTASLDHQPPEEISEILAPIIHGQDKGGSAAVVIEYKFVKESQDLGISETEEPMPESNPEEQESEENIPQKLLSVSNYFNPLVEKIKLSGLKRISHSRKIIFTIAVVILIVFILAINFAIKKQNEAKIQSLFNDIYPKAQKEYEAGKNLVGLNKNLARDNFTSALKILEDGKSKFPKDSKEEKQIIELMAKVNKELEANSPEKIAQNQERDKISISIENGSGIEGAAGKASDFLKGKGYNVISTGNAKNYNYKGATIKVKSSTNAYLLLLKNDLSEKYTVNDTSSDLSQDFAADVLVVIGK
ncbi:MAG: LytR C-terminal domain-containing protein [Candidatus Levybacteria bacterium]|nr:LytR C-terminal domain-containing protein [Candidatus Levybacteria bacterium]